MNVVGNTSRGLLASMDVEAIAARMETSPYRDLWLRFQSRTRETMAAARKGGFRLLGTGSLSWHSHTPAVREAALLWRLAGNRDALLYVEQCIEAVESAHHAPSLFIKAIGNKPPVNAHGEVALAADMARDGLPDTVLQRLCRLMRDHWIDNHLGAEAYANRGGGGNISYCQVVNAAFCAMTWGPDSGHSKWMQTVDHAIEHTRCYLAYGCDDGGFGYEGTAYSHEVFHFMYLFAQLLYQNGFRNLFEDEPRMRTAVEASLHLTFPGAHWMVNSNDHGLLMPHSLSWLLYTTRHFNDPLHLGLWYAYQGPDHPVRPYGDVMPWYCKTYQPGSVPVDQNAALLQTVLYWDASAPFTPITASSRSTVAYAPGTHTSVMRTSWDADAVALYLPGAGRSHASQTHRHADCGHFCIHAYGEYLAIDTGRYNVDEDQHSVVLVDGKCHLPNQGWGMSHLAGRKTGFYSSDLCTHICADAAHMKDCIWADRHFLFVPYGSNEAYIVMVDNINKDNARHEFRWQLHANPECSLDIQGPDSAVLRGGQARLDLQFLVPPASDFPASPHRLTLSSDEAEWSWPYGRQGHQIHASTGLMITSFRRPRLLAHVEGANCRLMTVMMPRRLEAPVLAVNPRVHPGLLAVEIETPAGTDLVVAALDHGYIRIPELHALTHLALIRQPAGGGEPVIWTL